MQENRLKLTKKEYMGKPSTLCKGCGHDSITNCIISAYFELGVEPHRVIKASGIGCSSKTPTYFLERSQGFNSVHGRMPSIATGAAVANRSLETIGVSGDGDSMSIGLGQFGHLLRRNMDMVYIVENNGCYGLTKGQFSATADEGSKAKKGEENPFPVMDICEMGISFGATFVARSFSGDRKQLISLLKAAISHEGIALLDVISPCVTFNNHEGSTKSYDYVKNHDIPIHELGYVPSFETIETEIKEGEVKEIKLHDGSTLTLNKLDGSYDPQDKLSAFKIIEDNKKTGQIPTGLLYYNANKPGFKKILNMSDRPLVDLKQDDLNPGPDALKKICAALK